MDKSKDYSNENLKRKHYDLRNYITRAIKIVSLSTAALLGAEYIITELGWNKYTSSEYVPQYTIETEGNEDLSRIIWTRRTTEQIEHSPLWKLLIDSDDEVIVEERKVEG